MRVSSLSQITFTAAFFCLLVARTVGEQEPQWSYDDRSTLGPTSWGAIRRPVASDGSREGSFAFPSCSGGQQSPIDLSSASIAGAAEHTQSLTLSWPAASNITVLHRSDRTLRVFFNDIRGIVRDPISGQQYQLQYMDVRSPSEHTFGSAARDVEVQLMHVGVADETAYLAVALTYTASPYSHHHFLSSILASAGPRGTLRTVATAGKRIAELFPPQKDYYFYRGSLTYPPCTVGVRWIIMSAALPIGAHQVQQLHQLLGTHMDVERGALGNARPVQPLGSREVVRHLDFREIVEACPELRMLHAEGCRTFDQSIDKTRAISIAALFFAILALLVALGLISAMTIVK